MLNSIQEVQKLGQSIWYDNIRRGLIKSGELASLIELGVSGVTSNPTIFEKPSPAALITTRCCSSWPKQTKAP